MLLQLRQPLRLPAQLQQQRPVVHLRGQGGGVAGPAGNAAGQGSQVRLGGVSLAGDSRGYVMVVVFSVCWWGEETAGWCAQCECGCWDMGWPQGERNVVLGREGGHGEERLDGARLVVVQAGRFKGAEWHGELQ